MIIKNNMTRQAVALALLFGLLTTAAGCSSEAVKPEHRIRSVRAAEARTAAISVNEEYAGTVRPTNEVNVASTIGGRVEKVCYDVGDSVAQGAVLFTLKADAGQTTEARAKVEQAQLEYNLARDSYNRVKSLFDANATSQQALDEADTAAQNALVELNAAQESLDLVTNNNTEGKGNLVVTAPMTGIISARNIDPGEMTSATVSAFTIMDPASLYVEIGVSDQAVGKMASGQRLAVVIDALKTPGISGKVDQISPNADPKTRLYNVRINLDPAGQKLHAGMIAKVLVPVESKGQALQIPNQAIVVEAGQPVVYTVVNGTIRKKVVQTGIAGEINTEITRSLKKGDLVVIEGQHLLQEGEKVKALLITP